MSFGYFYGDQGEQFAFYRTPKVFFTDPRFSNLSVLAKVLYGIMLDRVSLSGRNGWKDEQGRIYIIFALRSIMDALGCSDKPATRVLTELENYGLIERKRQGQGKPSLIYVKNFIDSENIRFQTRRNSDSRVGEGTIQDSENLRCNKTEYINTENNETDLIVSPEKDAIDVDNYRSYFSDSLEIEILKKNYPHNTEMLDGILELIVEICTTGRRTIRIAGDEKPTAVVQGRFMKLTSEHIQYVMECLKETTSEIRNVKQYMLAALYNAPVTIDSYYTAMVNHDMATGFGKEGPNEDD